jgi:hypothetical protein
MPKQAKRVGGADLVRTTAAVEAAVARAQSAAAAVHATRAGAGTHRGKTKTKPLPAAATGRVAATAVRVLALMAQVAGRRSPLAAVVASGPGHAPAEATSLLWAALCDSTQAARAAAAAAAASSTSSGDSPALEDAPPPPESATEAPAESALRAHYMAQMTGGFGESLDRLRREEDLDTTRLAVLVDCLERGGDLFARLEGAVLAASLADTAGAARAGGRPTHRPLVAPSAGAH